MKITGVTVIPASYATDDNPPFRRSFAVVRLDTDEGVTGWGEASDCYGHRYPLTLKALFEETMQWLLLGRDPLPLEDLMRNLRRTLYAPLGARGLVIQALSAIDIALWDIRGKVLGTSVSELLGRKRESVQLYAAGKPALYEPPERNAEFFGPLLERGVTAVKVRTGRDFEWDRAMVEQVRELLPDGIEMCQSVSRPVCAARRVAVRSVASGWPMTSSRANKTLPFTCCRWIAEDSMTWRGNFDARHTA
jgi:L-alanine-DL-glutamate epimerase-like enolase superfamily enzyme